MFKCVDKTVAVFLELFPEILLNVIIEIQRLIGDGPDPLHGFVRKHFLQLHDLLSYREQRFLPCNKIVVMDGYAEAFYPLAYGMLFGTISALNGVDDILDPGTLNGVRIRFFRIQFYAAAQWEQGANCRLCIMNRTFPVPEQRATLNRSSRLEPYNGDSGVLPQIYLAIMRNGVPWRKPQFLGYVVEVFGIQETPISFLRAVFVKQKPLALGYRLNQLQQSLYLFHDRRRREGQELRQHRATAEI